MWIFSSSFQAVHLLLLQLFVLSWMMLHRETEYNQRSQGTRAKVAEPTVLEHIWPEKLTGPPSFILTPNTSYCMENNYLVVVFTRIDEPFIRERFRSTYGRLASKYNFTIVFPLGVTNSSAVNADVLKEHAKHDDILQADFMDTYYNLTLKSYSYRNYVRQHCMSVRVVLKLDDDVVWNVDSMIKYLSQIDDGGNMVLHCRSQKRIFVVRNVTSRWYLHPKEYPYRHFPEYCISGASAATPQTIAALAEASNTVPYVWIDDVWSLGLVPRKVGATFHSMPYGGIKGFFDPFLNGSVIAQDFKRQEEGLYLFTQVNGKLL